MTHMHYHHHQTTDSQDYIPVRNEQVQSAACLQTHQVKPGDMAYPQLANPEGVTFSVPSSRRLCMAHVRAYAQACTALQFTLETAFLRLQAVTC